jgi:acetyl esterase/lipase
MAFQLALQNYFGDADPADPGLTPLNGEFRPGWPPTVVVSGTRDIMLSSTIRTYWAVRDAGSPAELLISEGMWHGFYREPALPEAVRARAAVREFLITHLDAHR